MARKSFGRIEKLPSGRYRARYPDPTPGSKARIAAESTFSTKTAAERWLTARQDEIAAGTWIHPDDAATAAAEAAAEAERKNIAVGDYAERWIQQRLAAGKIGEHQEYLYRLLWRGAVAKSPGQRALMPGRLNAFVDRPISAVTASEVREWHAGQLGTKKLTATSRAYEHLKTVFAAAVEDELIEASPCKLKDAKTTTGRKRLPPTDEELAAVIEAMPERLRSLTVMAAAMGGRFGELTALTSGDVTVHRNDEGGVDKVTVRVAEAISYVPGRGRFVKGTKTEAGERTVSVFGDDALVIAAHVEGMEPGQLLWTDSTGRKPLPHKTFHDQWAKAREVAGRPDLELHSLRHYHGSRYAQLSGASLAEVMARLGHKSVAAAMRYQHAGSRADELARRAAR